MAVNYGKVHKSFPAWLQRWLGSKGKLGSLSLGGTAVKVHTAFRKQNVMRSTLSPNPVRQVRGYHVRVRDCPANRTRFCL